MEQRKNSLVREIKDKKILHWNFRELTDLPVELKNWGSAVEEFYLKENKLTALPGWFCDLTNLTNLYLSGNKVRQLPEDFGRMSQLRVLDLSGNELKSLPSSVRRLRSIRELILDDNSLSQLPPEFQFFDELETLSLCENQLTTLPEWLGSLKRLDKLLVDGNCLKELPNRLTLSPSLRIVSVCSNRLRYLPLNSFASPTLIYFNCNPQLNYLSYSVLCQLLELGWSHGKSCFSANSHLGRLRPSKNVRLSVDLDDGVALIELPRQLMKLFSSDDRTPPSLWELSLRTLYGINYEEIFERSTCPKHDVFYKVFHNGPVGICLNDRCRRPTFTEAWLTVGSSEESSLLVILLFCSQKCARLFDFSSHGISVLKWR